MQTQLYYASNVNLYKFLCLLSEAESHFLNFLFHLTLQVALTAGCIFQDEYLQDKGREDAATTMDPIKTEVEGLQYCPCVCVCVCVCVFT